MSGVLVRHVKKLDLLIHSLQELWSWTWFPTIQFISQDQLLTLHIKGIGSYYRKRNIQINLKCFICIDNKYSGVILHFLTNWKTGVNAPALYGWYCGFFLLSPLRFMITTTITCIIFLLKFSFVRVVTYANPWYIPFL